MRHWCSGNILAFQANVIGSNPICRSIRLYRLQWAKHDKHRTHLYKCAESDMFCKARSPKPKMRTLPDIGIGQHSLGLIKLRYPNRQRRRIQNPQSLGSNPRRSTTKAKEATKPKQHNKVMNWLSRHSFGTNEERYPRTGNRLLSGSIPPFATI